MPRVEVPPERAESLRSWEERRGSGRGLGEPGVCAGRGAAGGEGARAARWTLGGSRRRRGPGRRLAAFEEWAAFRDKQRAPLGRQRSSNAKAAGICVHSNPPAGSWLILCVIASFYQNQFTEDKLCGKRIG